MKGLKILLILTVLLSSSLFASTQGQYFSASASTSYYLGIAHYEDEIPARSSLAAAVSIGLLGYQAPNWEASLQTHMFFVTDSLAYGNYSSRGFNSIGLSLFGAYNLTDRFSLSLQAGTEVNFYHKIEEVFASFSLQVAPQFKVFEDTSNTILVTVPISVHLRKEITAIQAGIGVRYLIFPHNRGMT